MADAHTSIVVTGKADSEQPNTRQSKELPSSSTTPVMPVKFKNSSVARVGPTSVGNLAQQVLKAHSHRAKSVDQAYYAKSQMGAKSANNYKGKQKQE